MFFILILPILEQQIKDLRVFLLKEHKVIVQTVAVTILPEGGACVKIYNFQTELFLIYLLTLIITSSPAILFASILAIVLASTFNILASLTADNPLSFRYCLR